MASATALALIGLWVILQTTKGPLLTLLGIHG